MTNSTIATKEYRAAAEISAQQTDISFHSTLPAASVSTAPSASAKTFCAIASGPDGSYSTSRPAVEWRTTNASRKRRPRTDVDKMLMLLWGQTQVVSMLLRTRAQQGMTSTRNL